MEGTLLIIDKDPLFSSSCAAFFTNNGFMVSAHDDFETGLHELDEKQYDVAVIEFCNPLYKRRIVDALQYRKNGTAVVLTCRYYNHESEKEARNLSPAFYFTKPFELADLYAVVVRVMELKNKRNILAVQRMKYREGDLHE